MLRNGVFGLAAAGASVLVLLAAAPAASANPPTTVIVNGETYHCAERTAAQAVPVLPPPGSMAELGSTMTPRQTICPVGQAPEPRAITGPPPLPPLTRSGSLVDGASGVRATTGGQAGGGTGDSLPPNGPYELPGTADYYWASEGQFPNESEHVTGLEGYMTYQHDYLGEDSYHSLSQLWAIESFSGGYSDVEFGWINTPGETEPWLFVYHFDDSKATCYDECGFVQTSNTVGHVVGYPISSPASLFSIGPTHHYQVYEEGTTGKWYVAVDGEVVGYYPASAWTYHVPIYLTNEQAGGEVASYLGEPTPQTTMGDAYAGSSEQSADWAGIQDRPEGSARSVDFTPINEGGAGWEPAVYSLGTSGSFTDGGPAGSNFRYGGPGWCNHENAGFCAGAEPTVTLEAATGVTSTSATVSGTVDPNNLATEYRFECVPVAHQEANECGAPQESAGEGDNAVKVSYTYKNLTPETTYDYWLKGTNAFGTVYTAEGSFNTLPVDAPPAAKYVSSFGTEGTGEGQFKEPTGVARDSKGDLWVVDSGNERVQELSEEGKFILMFGKEVNKTKVEAKGTEAEEDLCTAASGNVCQAGKEGSGNSQFKGPRGIAIDVHNNVWVADNGNGRVKEFNEKGEFARRSEVAVDAAAGVAIGPQGNIWATEELFDSRVLELSGEGKQLLEFGSFGSECRKEYEFFDPAGIAVANGHVWMDDVYCDRIDEFNEAGNYLERFGRDGSGYGELDEPSGVAVDGQGHVWALDSGNDRVEEFTEHGKYLNQFGTEGTGAGEFNLGIKDVGIATDSKGHLWVVDSGNDRVQLWEHLAPEVVTKAASSVRNFETTLNATVNPMGLATTYHFEYGTSSSYGTSVPVPSGSIGSGVEPVAVSQTITGLAPNTTYDYRISAENSEGTVYTGSNYAENHTFTTTKEVPVEYAQPTGDHSEQIVEGPDGDLWFTDWDTSKIGKMATSGKVEAEYALPAKNEASESAPAGITPGPAGEKALWFTDHNSGKIGRITTSGEVKEYSLPARSDPYNIVAGSDGNLWFTEFGTNKIGKIAASGKVEAEYSLPKESTPLGIVAGPDGNLWFTEDDTSKIGKMTTSGKIEAEYSLPAGSRPWGIVAGRDGNLWFVDYETSKVGKITTSGAITEYALPSGSYPRTIAAGPDGDLWFTEPGNSKIGEITIGGAIVEYAQPAGSGPFGIASGPETAMWFTDYNDGEIAKLALAQMTPYSQPAGDQSEQIVEGPDGDLWFTDWGTSKIGKMTASGKVEAEYALPAKNEASESAPAGLTPGPGGEDALWFTDDNAIMRQSWHPKTSDSTPTSAYRRSPGAPARASSPPRSSASR